MKNGEGKKTRIFGDYLERRYGKSIPQERTYFLILPHGCQGAIVESFRGLDLSLFHGLEWKLIASNKEALSYRDLPEEKCLIDRKGHLDRLALPFHNLSLVVTEKGKVRKILSDPHCRGDMGEKVEAFLKEKEPKGPGPNRP